MGERTVRPEVLRLMNALPSESSTSECVKPVVPDETGPLTEMGAPQLVVVVPPEVLVAHVVVVVVEIDPVTWCRSLV